MPPMTTRVENFGPVGLGSEFRRDEVWIAYGHDEVLDAAQRLHTSTGPSLSVPGVIGCTACSVDGGRSWTLIDT